eukprot:Plantae.Rhodophyta-Rhodochaete_pulchella.ctg535.p1 GENE.Plantae.Rhodophyta-Rhodochaete_pulchella.ctg535~~Plantae.Rhodophyta-Rhodochaete_pulchella.ctg535.p1  ORF type:complete len:687 (+),score=138.17 Plantae.Rhodophyta-Rhodochaete_pulchella.ctg535:112-2172(+)
MDEEPRDGSSQDVALTVDSPFQRTKTVQGDDEVAFDPWFAAIQADEEADDLDPTATTSFFARNKAVHLQWENLEYSVGVKKPKQQSAAAVTPPKDVENPDAPPAPMPDRKVIITNVSGQVKPGEILAIMGSSGAGKTTLLNLLAGRLTTSRNYATKGRVLINGLKRDPRMFKKISAYVEQDDKMFGELKVEEQLAFSAYLRLPKSMAAEKKRERVENTIQELGLSKVRESYIGNEFVRGVSGGERKRVNVGTELVADPSLLFLDEPTTGLDSFNALNVMYTLRKLASAGRTIVTTIHQPRSNIFNLFDKLLLLSEGRVMYYGPASNAVDYFSGFRFVCPSQFNPADYFIDLLSIDPRSQDLERRSRNRVGMLGSAFDESENRPRIQELKSEDLAETEARMKEMARNVQFETSWPAEFGLVLRRTFKLVLREKAGNIARLVQTIIFGLLLGLIWLNEARDFDPDTPPNQRQVQAIGGIIFFLLVNQGFDGVFSVIFQYPLEKAVVLRERSSATYRVHSYMLARTLADVPRNLLFDLIFSVLVYFMVGLRIDAGAFFYFVLTVLLIISIAEGFTLCIATFTPDPQTSAAITPVFMILFMLFGGFFIDAENMPGALSWIRWISFIFYGMNGLLHNQFDGSESQSFVEDLFKLEVSRGVSIVVLFAMAVFFRALWYGILLVKGPKFSRSL